MSISVGFFIELTAYRKYVKLGEDLFYEFEV